VTLSNLTITSFRPRTDPGVPLSPRQSEQLGALNAVLDSGDGVLRVAAIGPQMVGHLFLLLRLSSLAARLVSTWTPERPGLAARLHETRSAYVTDVLVKEGYRRLGIASELLADAMALARAQGLVQLVLHVRTDNGPALALYQRLRFETRDVVEGAVECRLSLSSAAAVASSSSKKDTVSGA
jgi:diamine N-acetyltransferase